MSHAFYRTAQGRLPKPMSSKGKTTFFFEKTKITGGGFLIIKKIEWEINNAFDFSEDFYGKIRLSWREKSLIV